MLFNLLYELFTQLPRRGTKGCYPKNGIGNPIAPKNNTCPSGYFFYKN